MRERERERNRLLNMFDHSERNSNSVKTFVDERMGGAKKNETNGQKRQLLMSGMKPRLVQSYVAQLLTTDIM